MRCSQIPFFVVAFACIPCPLAEFHWPLLVNNFTLCSNPKEAWGLGAAGALRPVTNTFLVLARSGSNAVLQYNEHAPRSNQIFKINGQHIQQVRVREAVTLVIMVRLATVVTSLGHIFLCLTHPLRARSVLYLAATALSALTRVAPVASSSESIQILGPRQPRSSRTSPSDSVSHGTPLSPLSWLFKGGLISKSDGRCLRSKP